MKQNQLYWLCQFLGWGVVYTGFLLLNYFIFNPNEPEQRLILLQFIIGANMLLVSHGMRLYLKRNGWTQRPISWLLPRIFLLILTAAVVVQGLIHLQMIIFLDWLNYRPIVFKELLIYLLNVKIMFWLWGLVYFSVKYFQQYRSSEIEKWKLQAMLKETELRALKSQINPHFMFNALNNIRALTREDAERARQMIGCLSDLLRYAVHISQHEQVSVAEEMEIVEDYLRLEAVHYEERLRYELKVAPETLSLKLPPMSVQLLVENAIKHGISLLRNGGFVKVTVQLQENGLLVEVENSGQLQPGQSSTGLGLHMIRERARLLFGDEAKLQLENSSNEAVYARLQIPQLVVA